MSRVALFALCVLSFVPLLAFGIDVGARGHHPHGQKLRIELEYDLYCSEVYNVKGSGHGFCAVDNEVYSFYNFQELKKACKTVREKISGKKRRLNHKTRGNRPENVRVDFDPIKTAFRNCRPLQSKGIEYCSEARKDGFCTLQKMEFARNDKRLKGHNQAHNGHHETFTQRARFFRHMRNNLKGRGSKQVKEAIETLEESLKFDRLRNLHNLKKACKIAKANNFNKKSFDDVVYAYRNCRPFQTQHWITNGLLPGTVRTYIKKMNFVDFSSKRADLNPVINIPYTEDSWYKCAEEYGDNHPTCNHILNVVDSPKGQDDVEKIWKDFRDNIESAECFGVGAKELKDTFKGMEFNEKFELSFSCPEQPKLCACIMQIGHANRAKGRFRSEDGSKLIIKRNPDSLNPYGLTTGKNKCSTKSSKEECMEMGDMCHWIKGKGHSQFCDYREIKIGTVEYEFIPGNGERRRRLLQGGASGES